MFESYDINEILSFWVVVDAITYDLFSLVTIIYPPGYTYVLLSVLSSAMIRFDEILCRKSQI